MLSTNQIVVCRLMTSAFRLFDTAGKPGPSAAAAQDRGTKRPASKGKGKADKRAKKSGEAKAAKRKKVSAKGGAGAKKSRTGPASASAAAATAFSPSADEIALNPFAELDRAMGVVSNAAGETRSVEL